MKIKKKLRVELEKLIQEIKGLTPFRIYTICIIIQLNIISYFARRMLVKVDKFEEDKKLKYPKRLNGDKSLEVFEENKYYIVAIQRPQNKKSIVYLTIAIIVVLMVCLFPIWPLWLKLSIWWVLFIFLLAIVIYIYNL